MNGQPRRIELAERAVRDLLAIEAGRRGVLERDLQTLASGRLPLTQTKIWELKSGSYRALYRPEPDRLVVVRVVNRRDLVRALRGIR